ncbi:hypothetical protein R3P38DRAFT_3219024 [Favolaschia claudopus]|uniref:Bacteriophage T5 Orf172 DNA-binding domain-containing protein n=1 Tax=Favolaschia claudopus TaxID=2862362 RepID=A0AAW0A1Z8_9AGAR
MGLLALGTLFVSMGGSGLVDVEGRGEGGRYIVTVTPKARPQTRPVCRTQPNGQWGSPDRRPTAFHAIRLRSRMLWVRSDGYSLILPSRHKLFRYQTQITSLVTKKAAYKLEGHGDLYVVACVADEVLDNHRHGRISAGELYAQVKLKLGHTKKISRRRAEYRYCDVGQTHAWLYAFRVKRRYLAERLIHLTLLQYGATRVVCECPGCFVFHREYFEYFSIGGVTQLNEVVERVLISLGESIERRKLKSSFADIFV